MGSADAFGRSVESDEELMARFRETGDEKAYAELVKRYRGQIQRYIRGRGRRACDADDLTQEVFLAVFKSRQRYEIGRSFNAWIYAIATHEMRDAHKYETRKCRNRPRPPEGEANDNVFDAEDESQSPVFDCTDTAKIRTLVASLPDDERSAIDLVFFQGMSWRDASSQLGIAHGSFCTTITRAMQRLREQFNRNKTAA